MNGTKKIAHADDEDAKKIYNEVLQKEMTDEDLSNWVFETWDGVHTSIEKIAALAYKMHAFSSATKNVHREMKNWCAELKEKAHEASTTTPTQTEQATGYWTSLPPCWKRAYGKPHQP